MKSINESINLPILTKYWVQKLKPLCWLLYRWLKLINTPEIKSKKIKKLWYVTQWKFPIHNCVFCCRVFCCLVFWCLVFCCPAFCCLVFCCLIFCCRVFCCRVFCCRVLCCLVFCCRVFCCRVFCFFLLDIKFIISKIMGNYCVEQRLLFGKTMSNVIFTSL